MAVHPHMRGVNVFPDWPDGRSYGSSPHAWGQYHRRPLLPAGRRFIPTCVGSMVQFRCGLARTAVHPHMRGVNGVPRLRARIHIGSSPHAWGQWMVIFSGALRSAVHPHMRGVNIPCRVRVSGYERFIPTCVGSIYFPSSISGVLAVHPHMRGVNESSFDIEFDRIGSSPHAWGQLFTVAKIRRSFRFIPTCVGSITFVASEMTFSPGSSPHAWGQ